MIRKRLMRRGMLAGLLAVTVGLGSSGMLLATTTTTGMTGTASRSGRPRR